MAEKQQDAFFLLRQLSKLDPYQHEQYLYELLQIFFSIDVNLPPRIVEFLEPAYGFEHAQGIVHKALGKGGWKVPLDFELTRSHGWTIVCRVSNEAETAGAAAAAAGGGGGGDSHKKKENNDDDDFHGEGPFIKEIQGVTDDGLTEGYLLATVREGDSICLKSHSTLWWLVYELRPHSQTIMLSQPATKRRKMEYKEIKPVSLLGCMVRREGVLSAKTLEKLAKGGSSSLVNYDEKLLNVTSEVDYEGSAISGATSRRVCLVFQMPGPDAKSSIERIKLLVRAYPALTTRTKAQQDEAKRELEAAKASSMHMPPIDPTRHMQRQAQVKSFVAKWEDTTRAKTILRQIDPYPVVFARDKWLLLCRVLRTICRGGHDLLNEFCQWTKQAGKEGKQRALDCQAAWDSLRPATSCDLPSLCRARAYLKSKGANRNRAFFDEHGRLRPEHMKQDDPVAHSVLEAVATHASDRSILFYPQSLSDKIRAAAGPTTTTTFDSGLIERGSSSCAVVVPAALYIDNVYSHVEALSAYITVGDVLFLQADNDKKQVVWAQVLAVDLLFARLRVMPRSSPPPSCWFGADEQPQQQPQATPIWVSVSKLWGITVSRLLPPSSSSSSSSTTSDAKAKSAIFTETHRHVVFVTPCPLPSEALAILGIFERRDATEAAAPPIQTVAAALVVPPAPPAAQKLEEKSTAKAKTKKGKQEEEKLVKKLTKSRKQREKEQEELQELLAAQKLLVTPLRFFIDAVIVSWKLAALPAAVANAEAAEQEEQGEYVVEMAYVHAPHEWLPVYRGKGLACQISGLEQLHKYHCRVTVVHSQKRGHVVLCTLGKPPTHGPLVVRWEEASVVGNARGLVRIEDFVDLPPECYYQVEGSLGNDDDVLHAGGNYNKETRQPLVDSWMPVARTRSSATWIVGPFCGKSLLLRVRVINDQGQAGPCSPSSFFIVPLVNDKAGAKEVTAFSSSTSTTTVATSGRM